MTPDDAHRDLGSSVNGSQEVVAPEQHVIRRQWQHHRARAEHTYPDGLSRRRRRSNGDLRRQEAVREPGMDRRALLHWLARDQRLQQRYDAGA